MKKINSSKGITLVALVITVIVLIILASISIAAISGNNSIVNQATKSKDNTEIVEEKELLNRCVAYAITNSKNGALKKDDLEDQIENNAQGREFQITEQDIIVDENTTEGIIKVTFQGTQHTYRITQEGIIEIETSQENQGD